MTIPAGIIANSTQPVTYSTRGGRASRGTGIEPNPSTTSTNAVGRTRIDAITSPAENGSGFKFGKIHREKATHLRFDLHVFRRSFVHLEHMYRFCVGRAGQVQTARRERQAVDCSGSLKASEENENVCLSHFS